MRYQKKDGTISIYNQKAYNEKYRETHKDELNTTEHCPYCNRIVSKAYFHKHSQTERHKKKVRAHQDPQEEPVQADFDSSTSS